MLIKVNTGEFTTSVHHYITDTASRLADVDSGIRTELVDNSILPDKEDEGWMRTVGHSATYETQLFGIHRADSMYRQFIKDGDTVKLAYVLHLLEDASSPVHTLVVYGQDIHVDYEHHIDKNFSRVKEVLDKYRFTVQKLDSAFRVGKYLSDFSRGQLFWIVTDFKSGNYDGLYDRTAKCIGFAVPYISGLLMDANQYL